MAALTGPLIIYSLVIRKRLGAVGPFLPLPNLSNTVNNDSKAYRAHYLLGFVHAFVQLIY